MSIVIEVQAVDITADVIFADAEFSTQTGRSPGGFQIRVRDDDKTYNFVAGNRITLDVSGVRSFDGYILQAEQAYPFDVDDTTGTHNVSRIWSLTGVDVNILFEKRIVFDQTTPSNDTIVYDPETDDTTYLDALVNTYLDLSADNLTFNFENVGTPNPDYPGSLMPGETWGYNMSQIAHLPGAIWGIRPTREVYYEDNDSVTAPFALSDQPNNSTSFGYSNLAWLNDGTKLVNDALLWGAGTGSSNRVLSRTEDATSIAAHGRWQTGQFRRDIYRQATADMVSESLVYGSPQNLHGAKDDAAFVTCRIRQPGLMAGQKVRIISGIFGLDEVYPIRRITITFANPNDALFDLQLTWEVDAALNYSEFWNPRRPRPPQPVILEDPSCIMGEEQILTAMHGGHTASFQTLVGNIGTIVALPPPPVITQPDGGLVIQDLNITPPYVPFTYATPGPLSVTVYGGGLVSSNSVLGTIATTGDLHLESTSLDFDVSFRLNIFEPSDYLGVNGSDLEGEGGFVIGQPVFTVQTFIDGGYHISDPTGINPHPSDTFAFSGLAFTIARDSPGSLAGLPKPQPLLNLYEGNYLFNGQVATFVEHDSPTIYGTMTVSRANNRISSVLSGSFGSFTSDTAYNLSSMQPPFFFIRAAIRAKVYAGTTSTPSQFRALRAALTIDQVVWRNVDNCAAIGGQAFPGATPAGSYGCEQAYRVSSTVFETSRPYTGGTLLVYRDGTRQRRSTDYNETGLREFTFRDPLGADENVSVCYFAYGTSYTSVFP